MTKKLKEKYLTLEQLDQFSNSNDNRLIKLQILGYVKQFTNDRCTFEACLAQNLFDRTALCLEDKCSMDSGLYSQLAVLNQLYDRDESFFRDMEQYRDAIILFLADYHFFLKLKYRDSHYLNSPFMSRRLAIYCQRLLDSLGISELKSDIEDEIFAILNPDLYQEYLRKVKYRKGTYLEQEKRIKNYFQKLLKKNGIIAEIEARVKTISSLHEKIVKKDLLFSQIYDAVGLRIIVRNNDECYRVMGMILINHSILTSRVKDYIAIPKDNGYQSLHMTVMFGKLPVEIQIRTWEMHAHAQYGKAAHGDYKNAARRIRA